MHTIDFRMWRCRLPYAEWLVQNFIGDSVCWGSEMLENVATGYDLRNNRRSKHSHDLDRWNHAIYNQMWTHEKFCCQFFVASDFLSKMGFEATLAEVSDGWVRNFSPTRVLLCNFALFLTFRTPIRVFSIKSKVFHVKFHQKAFDKKFERCEKLVWL